MDEHGTVNRRVEDFIAWVSDVTKPFVRTMHSLGQMLIRVDGNKAVTETYFTAFYLRPDAQGRLFDEFIAGRSIEGGQFLMCVQPNRRGPPGTRKLLVSSDSDSQAQRMEVSNDQLRHAT